MDNNKPQGIYPAMVRVMRGIGAISKERVSPQGYKFRGIEDFYNALHDVMAKEGVFCTLEIVSENVSERETKSGTLMLHRTVTYKVNFVCGDDGSVVSTYAIGEAMDTSDKSAAKTASMAQKYALNTTFLIPFAEMDDPDEHSPVVQVPDEQQSRPTVAQPKQPQAARPIPTTPVNQQQREKLFALYKEVFGSGKTDEEVEQELKKYVESELGHPPEQMTMAEWAKVMTKLQETKKARRG